LRPARAAGGEALDESDAEGQHADDHQDHPDNVVADAREVRTDRRTGGSPRRRHPGTEAYFGRDVNAGLVSGIEKYVSDRERSYRSGVRRSILLGCSPWFTDVELLRALDLVSFACIVLSKRPQNEAEQFVARKLRQCNEGGKGVQARYFSELSLTRPKCDDQPIVLSALEAWNPADYFIPMEAGAGDEVGKPVGLEPVSEPLLVRGSALRSAGNPVASSSSTWKGATRCRSSWMSIGLRARCRPIRRSPRLMQRI
jgi:hypothetical protein